MHLFGLIFGLAILTQNCKSLDSNDWWKKDVFYQIYPRSFMDTNNDGIGDLKGIESKLDYLKSLGIGATWLSPIYKSPMKDFGYDISNFTAIEPMFGTMADFDNLVMKAHEKGLKIIMDFVPNHSSNEHEWFKKSEKKEEPYTDFYIWVDGIKTANGTEKPPNNWMSVFGGSAWEWSATRKQFYYHAFLKEQPDLNFRNKRIREEMKKILKFWFDKGIDGIRVDAVPQLFEDTQLRDDPPDPNSKLLPDQYWYYDHKYTFNLPEVLDVVREWKNVLQEYENRDGYHRLIMLETFMPFEKILPYFGNKTHPLADMPFNFGFMVNITGPPSGLDIYRTIFSWTQLPSTQWPNWILSNHDQPRIANRTHQDLRDAFNMLALLLKGTPITYYGEEIGMVNTFVTWEQVQDPAGKWYGEKNYTKFTRDPERSPMQWNSSQFAGFTRGNSTWLPVNNNSKWLNVEKQENAFRSHLKTYRTLVSLKKEKAILNGSTDFPIVTNDIFAFTRTVKNNPGFAVVINFGNSTQTVNLEAKWTSGFYFPSFGTAVALSDKLFPYTNPPITMSLAYISLPPRQAVVIKFFPIWK